MYAYALGFEVWRYQMNANTVDVFFKVTPPELHDENHTHRTCETRWSLLSVILFFNGQFSHSIIHKYSSFQRKI